jgi:hypothetical protein
MYVAVSDIDRLPSVYIWVVTSPYTLKYGAILRVPLCFYRISVYY